MARGRRRAPQRMMRTPRVRKDWVYRPNFVSETVDPFLGNDLLGSYDDNILGESSGQAGGNSRILYDSANRIQHVMRTGAGLTMVMPGAARVQGRGPTMHWVQGIIYVEPTNWAIGNLIAWGWRIGVFEQAPDSGAIEIDADYSMWQQVASAVPVATWANQQRTNLWERRIHYGFSDNQVFTTVRVSTRIRVRLQDHECLAIYTEGEATSVNIRPQYWLRTLVSAGL